MAAAAEAVEAPKKATPGSPGRLDKEYESEQAASRADAGAAIAGATEEVVYKEFVAWGAKDEELLYSQRANLFLWEDGAWNKMGSGDARLLQHLKSKQVRLVMQEEGTMRLVANHFVIDHHPYCELQPCVDSKTCWAWTAQDCSGDGTKISIFALQLPSEDLAAKFKDAFDHAKELNAEVKDFMDLNKVQSTNGDSAASPPPAAAANPFLNLFSSPASNSGPSAGVLGALPGSEAPQPPAAAEQQQDDDGYVVEEEVTNIPGWAPSVTLEVKDQVETGEEQEEEVYSQRAKLYRFSDGEWKERGLGDAKLWRHKETGMVRFMLRQEKTMKIVANHYIIDRPPYCDLQPNAGSEKCWVWSVQDYAEDSPEHQRFALKFGNPDLAGKFKVAFNNAKEQNAQVERIKELLPGAAASESAAPPAEASPELVKNTAAEPAEVANASATTTNAAAGMPFSTTSVSASDPSGQTEGAPPASPFVSLSSTSGQPPAEPPTAAAVSTDSKGVEQHGEEECYVVEEEEVTTIPGWAPSVHLEVRDHVETGEEDEEEIYSQRAKLYRFRDGEWKERGLGEAKLLKHRETGKVRLMLRQEKTMKIVANHYVIDHPPYCDLQPNAGSEKCWVWMAQDVSDGKLEVERFAMKFGQAELASKFKEAFGAAKEQNARVMDLAGLGGEGDASAKAPAASSGRTPGKGKDEKEGGGKEAAAEAPKTPPLEPSPPPVVAASTQPSLFSSTAGSRPAVNPFAGVTMNTAPEVSGSFFGASSGGSFSGLFSAPSGASTSSSFLPAAASATSASSGSGLFGGSGSFTTAATGGGLFTGFFNASNAASSSGGGLFSGFAGTASSGAASGGLFSSILASSSSGGTTAPGGSSGGSLFGGSLPAAASGATTGGSLFGGLPSASPGATGGLFSSIFSGSSSSSASGSGGGLFSGVGSPLFGGSSGTTSSSSSSSGGGAGDALTLTSTTTLNDGRKMPIFGLGVWRASSVDCKRAVLSALKAGYRHIDTAHLYENEREVGEAIRESGIPREEIWVTTKIWTSDLGLNESQRAADGCLERLGMDYVDLLLIHAPKTGYVEAWKGLEKVQAKGKAKSIGMSNCGPQHLERLKKECTVVPAVNQIELHPMLTQDKIVKYCDEANIRITAYAPLIRAKKFGHPKLKSVTAHYEGRTAAQVLIRWSIQRGFICIPKSVNDKRIRENADVFGWSLTDEDVATLNSMHDDHHECWDPTEWEA